MTVKIAGAGVGRVAHPAEAAPVENLRFGVAGENELSAHHFFLPCCFPGGFNVIALNARVCSASAVSTGRRSIDEAP